MDDHGQLEYATARGNDYLGHEQTYRTFVTMTKIATAVIAVIVILMCDFPHLNAELRDDVGADPESGASRSSLWGPRRAGNNVVFCRVCRLDSERRATTPRRSGGSEPTAARVSRRFRRLIL